MSYFITDPANKIYHDGKNVGVLKFGDSQSKVNELLAAEIEALKNSVVPQIADDSAMDTDKVKVLNGFGSTDSYTLYHEKFSVTTTPKQNTIGVEYDLANLSKGVTVKTVSVTVERKRAGQDAILVKSDKTFSTFNLSPENFPASLSVNIRVNDGTSDKVISGKMTLNPSGESGLYTVAAKDFNKSELTTQTKVNDYINSRISNIEKSLNSTIILGNTEYTIQQALSLIWQEIQDLKNLDLSTIKVSYYPTDNTTNKVTKTVSEAITDIYKEL